MKTFTFLGFAFALLLAGPAAWAQVPAAGPATPPPAAPSLITSTMATTAPAKENLKLRLDHNPVTNALTVRTDATGPTRVEVNGTDGRPVITRDLLAGDVPLVLSVANLPAGTYIVKCTSGERRGMKRVLLGN